MGERLGNIFSTVFETVLFVNILAVSLLLSVHSAKKLITCGITERVFTSQFEAAAEPRESWHKSRNHRFDTLLCIQLFAVAFPALPHTHRVSHGYNT